MQIEHEYKNLKVILFIYSYRTHTLHYNKDVNKSNKNFPTNTNVAHNYQCKYKNKQYR